jgi:hypothetical protein
MRTNYVPAHAATFSNQYSFVQSTLHGFATHWVARRKPMSMLGVGRWRLKRGRYARAQAHMTTCAHKRPYSGSLRTANIADRRSLFDVVGCAANDFRLSGLV